MPLIAWYVLVASLMPGTQVPDADWLSYRNTELGFAFRYPPSFELVVTEPRPEGDVETRDSQRPWVGYDPTLRIWVHDLSARLSRASAEYMVRAEGYEPMIAAVS
jgi:hypothetical protein